MNHKVQEKKDKIMENKSEAIRNRTYKIRHIYGVFIMKLIVKEKVFKRGKLI